MPRAFPKFATAGGPRATTFRRSWAWRKPVWTSCSPWFSSTRRWAEAGNRSEPGASARGGADRCRFRPASFDVSV